MRVVNSSGTSIELGTVQAGATIGIIDYSRRETDDFGVTTVVERGFARRMSVRLAVPFDTVDGLQRQLAALRASTATWIADETIEWLKPQGFFRDFSIDLATPPISHCTLTIEGLAETSTAADAGVDPSPSGAASTLQLLTPVKITDAILTASSVAEADAPAWAAGTTYAKGGQVRFEHRVYESLVAGNVGNNPSVTPDKWLDLRPTNRWAMFDEALGSSTIAQGQISVTLNAGGVNALAVIDAAAQTVRVQGTGYDQTVTLGAGTSVIQNLPGGALTITIAGPGQVSVGTLLIGKLVGLGVTEASPTAAIGDYSRKDVDDFGAVTVVQRAWAKRMTARALIRTDAIDAVANRIAAVRARPSLWIGQTDLDSLMVFGFFKDFSIEAGASVSKLSLSIEGLSKAAPAPANPIAAAQELADAAAAAAVAAQGTADAAKAAANAAATSAASGLAQIAIIQSDGWLSAGEKPDIIRQANDAQAIYSDDIAKAAAIGVSSTTYAGAYQALFTYLNALSPAYTNKSLDTAVVTATFDGKWSDYYFARTALLNAIAAKASQTANWGSVGGAGKPADNATVGAPSGTMVGNSSADAVVAGVAQGISLATGAGAAATAAQQTADAASKTLTQIGQFTTVRGNTTAKAGGAHAAVQGGAVGTPRAGAQFVSSSIINIEQGASWQTLVCLDPSGTSLPYEAQLFGLTVVAEAAGQARVYLHSYGSLMGSVLITGLNSGARVKLIWDGTLVYFEVAGVTYGKDARWCPYINPDLKLFPKFIDFHSNGEIANGRRVDCDYGAIGDQTLATSQKTLSLRSIYTDGRVQILGNTIRNTSNHGYTTAVVSEAIVGACYAQTDILTGGYTMVALNTVPNESYTGWATLHMNNATTWELYSGGTLISNGAVAGGAVGGTLTLACDRVSLYVIVNGVVQGKVAAPAALCGNDPIYPHWWAYNANGKQTGLKAGPYTSNKWADQGGAGKPEDNATRGTSLIYNGDGEIVPANPSGSEPLQGWFQIENNQSQPTGPTGNTGRWELTSRPAIAGSSGARVICLNKTNTNFGAGFTCRAFPVKPGEKIVVSADVASLDGDTGVGKYIVAMFSNGVNADGYFTAGIPGTNDYIANNSGWGSGWQHHEKVVTVPAGVTHMQVAVYSWQSGPNNTRWDNIAACRVTGEQTLFANIAPETGRANDAAFLPSGILLGVRSTTSAVPTATDQGGGSGVTVSIPAHTRKIGGKAGQRTISYGGGSIPNRPYNTTGFIYVDDPNLTGGAVTYGWTTNADDLALVGRYHVSTVPGVPQGGTSTGSGGGGSSTPPQYGGTPGTGNPAQPPGGGGFVP